MPILERFHVDLSILDHNYGRLKDELLDRYRKAHLRFFRMEKNLEQTFNLEEEEYPLLLEFYLQMDVDLFYMKTCSFRDAKPRSKIEGIFCATIPECRYTMRSCGHYRLCRTSIDMQYRLQPPVIFNRYEKHRFVNGYESILNCPATCTTTNIIYVLTCVCNQFDYISETAYSLEKRIVAHRRISSNVIYKLLLGPKNFQRLQIDPEYATANEKERMLLYQHPIQCTAAIQLFLDSNQEYWPFVPMRLEEANHENMEYDRRRQAQPSTTTSTTMSMTGQQARGIRKYLNDVPKAPAGYKFSKYQIEQQGQFFEKYVDSPPRLNRIDLYNAKIIAVLPLDTSFISTNYTFSICYTYRSEIEYIRSPV
ncbi:unnamed protein product [Rotaria sp. Silwood2]|nr:unnamed protein product [Rotaria sp. Silwood2]CAF4582638.1 unnamed protein product [Rotaria sp. Silwood2]